ncbi:MAG: bifunctional nuclease family protein [Phycisphaeraceae bacterium]|nr:bifunctional nuclease family protein [Phycisphaeraceae bacterium]
MSVQMELGRILIREEYESHILELREIEGDRVFPIVIGPNEALAIERRLLGKTPPRPQTHELLASVIDQLGAKVKSIIIRDLQDHTFYASLILEQSGKSIDIDSRPSDAIALGVAMDVPIFVEESVLEAICPSGNTESFESDLDGLPDTD